jgi:parallel beta-helix repeat protein
VCSGVSVTPQHKLQSLIDAHPSGTTFCLAPGTYPIASPLSPKPDHRFVSVEPRKAVLTGGGTTSMAFDGAGIEGVVLRGLVITRFSPPDVGGYAAVKASAGWRLFGNEISYNRNAGLYHERGAVIRWNYIHHNSKIGLGGYRASNSVIEHNRVAYNGARGGPDNGGSKWVGASNLTIRDNRFHDNYNNGLWVDGDNLNVTIEGNTVVSNQAEGIQYEISCAGVVRDNTVRGNGGAGIEVTASQDVTVSGNRVRDNGYGVIVWHQDRGAGSNCAWTLKNVRIRSNSVAMSKGYTGVRIWNVSDGTRIYQPSDPRVKFASNSYVLSGSGKYFYWANNVRSVPEWKSYGQDVDGTFSWA